MSPIPGEHCQWLLAAPSKEVGGEPTRTAQHSDQLGRAAAIVADRDDITERAPSALAQLVEDVHEAVGRGSTPEDDDALRPWRVHFLETERQSTAGKVRLG
jgi:hypothetical protein